MTNVFICTLSFRLPPAKEIKPFWMMMMMMMMMMTMMMMMMMMTMMTILCKSAICKSLVS